MQIIFWGSILFGCYAYGGYPVLLMLLSVFRNRPVQRGECTPSVSLIIAAFNEEKRIREKIENSLALAYPRSKLEIIVASDASSDATDQIVDGYRSLGVRLIRASQKMGKESVQKLAVESAIGQILVFSDVATLLLPHGISNIVRNFADSSVGCVSSVDRFIDQGGKISGEGIYVRYEMLLRNFETRVNTLIGLSGSFFAVRRELCAAWDVHLPSDFNILLKTVRAGLRGVSDPESVGCYRSILDEKKEYQRKVRTVLRGMAALTGSLSLLNPFKYGLFSWQLFSHKLCRWLVPFAMLSALVSNAWLAPVSRLYGVLLFVQLLLYGLVLVALVMGPAPRIKLLKIPCFLALVNLSILEAWFHFACGNRIVSWTPSER